jgi:hypothetical protein
METEYLAASCSILCRRAYSLQSWTVDSRHSHPLFLFFKHTHTRFQEAMLCGCEKLNFLMRPFFDVDLYTT